MLREILGVNHDEAENAAMAVLISNIKFIMDKHRNSNEILQNPFYLPIDANDKKLVKKYHAVYTAYCDVLTKSNPNHQQYDKNELSQLIKKYTHELIGLYATVLKENSPFNLTLPKFAEKYPAFTKEMSRFNHPQFSHAKFFGTTHSPKMMTLGELIAKLSHSLYLQHDYIPMKQSLQTPKKIQRMA